MRVALLSGLYPPHGGGAERATELLARGLVALGHEVHVVATAREAGTEAVGGIVVHRLAPRRAWIGDVFARPLAARVRWNLAELLDGRMAAAALRLLEGIAPALVVTANLKGLGGPLPRALGRLPWPHVHVAHDFEPVEPMLLGVHDRADGPRNRFWAALSRRRWGNPEAVVFPSAWLRDLFVPHGVFAGSRQAVIPNPVEAAGAGAQHAAPLPGAPFRMLFIGQLEPHKGALWAVDALRSWDAPWTLDVVGEGSERTAIDAKRDGRIRTHGRLTGAALEERWSAADALVVPSLCLENAPLVVFEAAARRVPVVAADVGGIPEYVLPGENGWRFAAADAQAFRFALATAADSGRRAALRWSRSAGPPLRSPEQYAREILALVPQAPMSPPVASPSSGILDLLPADLSGFKKDEAHYHDHATHDAVEVHQLDAFRNRFYHARIFRHLRPVAPEGWLLELAGGGGEDGADAVRLGLKVIETDISRGAVEEAAKRLAAVPGSAGRSIAATMDAERIPFPEASVAGAWMTASFHHAEDPAAVLREARRVLAPGARFAAAVEPHRLYFGAINFLKPLLDALLGARAEKSVADEEHSGFWRGELRAHFETAGFQDVRVEPMWFTAGILHYTLEFLTRLLKKKKRLSVPAWLEKACVFFDEFVFRIPGGAYLAWHWTASGRKP